MAQLGRPPKDPSEKKRKLHIAVDPEVFDFLEGLPNKSEFMNKAAWILMRAYKKSRGEEEDNGDPARE